MSNKEYARKFYDARIDALNMLLECSGGELNIEEKKLLFSNTREMIEDNISTAEKFNDNILFNVMITTYKFIGKIFNSENMREASVVSKNGFKVSKDLYTKILTKLDNLDKLKTKKEMEDLIEQIYCADIYYDNLLDYIINVNLATDDVPNRNFVMQMDYAQDKYNNIEKQYKKSK